MGGSRGLSERRDMRVSVDQMPDPLSVGGRRRREKGKGGDDDGRRSHQKNLDWSNPLTRSRRHSYGNQDEGASYDPGDRSSGP